jgi:D-xylose transport system substrate-binding protein
MSVFKTWSPLKSISALTCLAAAFGMSAGYALADDNAVSTVSATSFSADFSTLAQLKALAGQGKGKIGILLPETTTSARYTSFDEPYLRRAFTAAGLPADQFIITNAQGSESTELTQAQSAISQGATVLLMDPISSGVGASIETYANRTASG